MDVDLTVWFVNLAVSRPDRERLVDLRGQRAFRFPSRWWTSSPTPDNAKKECHLGILMVQVHTIMMVLPEIHILVLRET